MTKLFTCNAIKWFDKVNGNTYHSVRLTRHEDGQIIVSQFQSSYGEHYKQTALEVMTKANWLPLEYSGDKAYLYERNNNYPIIWNVNDGLKRNCIANGII